MNLEDHLGDIIRKARREAGVSEDAAARTLGCSAAEFADLEANGRAPGSMRLRELAPKIGLAAKKLAEVANGWLPGAPKMSQWRHIRTVTTTRGGNTVNCYLVWDEATRDAALFDTGWEARPIEEVVAQEGLKLGHLFLTHSHEDHIAAMEPLRRRFPQLKVHTQLAKAPAGQRLKAGEQVQLGSIEITHREVPGHAEDGVIYLLRHWTGNPPDVAVIGDTLFAGSMARGFISAKMLHERIREHIFSLQGSTLLCPGHGPLTTVAEELAHNPFF